MFNFHLCTSLEDYRSQGEMSTSAFLRSVCNNRRESAWTIYSVVPFRQYSPVVSFVTDAFWRVAWQNAWKASGMDWKWVWETDKGEHCYWSGRTCHMLPPKNAFFIGLKFFCCSFEIFKRILFPSDVCWGFKWGKILLLELMFRD